ncbi:MAG: amino acid adenylation protein, partial [Microlunatus sp.]|nr:amino acid adenylation protein [Microlunatus sp.]
PPVRLRRTSQVGDASRTYRPATRLKVARTLVELCRLVPWLGGFALSAAVVLLWLWLWQHWGLWSVLVLPGVSLMVGGAIASGIAVLAKWALVGRVRRGEHALWTSFVWRGELADAFVEMLAAPWLARASTGTPVVNLWLRAMGAKIGRGVWCETYWLPEPDLIELRPGSTVNKGCVVQTHLFHDRMLSLDTVRLRAGATIGPHSVILPAAELGRHSTVGPASLVMRGETVPDKTRWLGNPIGPWVD